MQRFGLQSWSPATDFRSDKKQYHRTGDNERARRKLCLGAGTHPLEKEKSNEEQRIEGFNQQDQNDQRYSQDQTMAPEQLCDQQNEEQKQQLHISAMQRSEPITSNTQTLWARVV